MDKLIENADFFHDDEDKYSAFDDKVDDWKDKNGEKVTSSQVLGAITALGKKLTKGKSPRYESEGWRQASRIAFDSVIEHYVSELLSENKIQKKVVQEAYFKLYLEWFKFGPTTIQFEIMKGTFSDSDVDMEGYLKSLKGKPRDDLIAAMLSPIKKNEETPDEKFYDKHRYYMSSFISNAFESSTIMEKDLIKLWLNQSFHLYLDYLSLEDNLRDHVESEADDRFSEISDVWENFSDEPTLRKLIEKIRAALNKHDLVITEKVRRTVCIPINKLSKNLRNPGDAEKYCGAIFDLIEAASRCKGVDKEIKYMFKETCSFIVDQPRDILKKKVDFFKAVAPKYIALLEKLDISFLENTRYASNIMDKLEEAFANNKLLIAEWIKLAVPLLKRPCKDCFRAAFSVLSNDDAVRWKDHVEVANQLLECFGHVTIPTEEDKETEDYISTFGRCIQYLLRGLEKARILKDFGERFMILAISLLELRSHNKELFDIIENLGEHIQINVKERKDKVMDVMKRVHEILKDEDLPWTESWPLQRAVQDVLYSIMEPVNDGRIFTDEDVKVFVAMCYTCLNKEALNPSDATLSAHFQIATTIMNKALGWMAGTKRLGYAIKLIPILMCKYDDEEENVSMLCGRYLNDFATGEAATTAPYLEQLIKIYLDKNDVNILTPINTTYPVNPAVMKNYFQDMISQLIDSREPMVKTWMLQIFWTASKKQPELFTEENIKDILQLAKDDIDNQSMLLMIIQEVSKRKPEKMCKYVDLLMDKNGWNPTIYAWLNDILSTLALFDKSLADKILEFLIKSVKENPDKGALLTALNSIRLVGFKHPEIIKLKRQQIVNLTIIDADGQGQKQTIIDMIDGKTPDDLRKQLESQQSAIGELVDKVEDVEEAVIAVQDEVDQQGQTISKVKDEVNQQGQRLDQVEDTVEETVAKVEEIDSKTLSHAPYWSRDISKLLNPATEHDWRLLSSRLGYSNADIRGWAQQADPCMAMLNEWYATRKTSEATFAVLNNLQEMNRMDAALIVENAMKKAEAVVEDEEFEYASPPPIFISYQWGHQEEVKLLHRHLSMAGYDCWMDIGQMGGGDKLFEKIDNGMRAAKLVISCVTTKYAKSPNCNREINLAVGVNKPIIPLLLENCIWPPPGSMGPIFSESLYIRFFQTGNEETKDDRYWAEDKFQELLMQLSVNGLTPDEGKIEPIYRNWWMPLEEEIKIDKSKTRDGGKKAEAQQFAVDDQPDVFISYQWGKQKNIIKLYQRLTSLGFSCWLDIKQMGGGDSLYDKIDKGIRGSKVVLSCITKKYALSANCRREVSLTDALKKPMVPLLLEEMTWPPTGPMSMVMTQLLYIDFQQEIAQTKWVGPSFEELVKKITHYIPEPTEGKPQNKKEEKPLKPKEKKLNQEETIKENPKEEKAKGPVAKNSEEVEKGNTPTSSPPNPTKDNEKAPDKQADNQTQEPDRPAPVIKPPPSSPHPPTSSESTPQKSKSCSVL